MERHDIELKEREDSVINVTSELAEVNHFSLTIYFVYKNEKYGAYCNYEVNGKGIYDINIYGVDKELETTDELEHQVDVFFREQFHIDEKTLDW
jgi:hypothetical protein|tara:strand:- start:3141 stop:3422 length:282 start_codon:yes stop_codon:yes gene_type:complete